MAQGNCGTIAELLQVSKLKLEVTRIRTDTGRKARQGTAEGKGVLEQVTNLQSALDEAKGGHEQLKMKARNAEMQKEAVSQRETQLKSEISGMRGKLEAADEQVDELRQQVCVPASRSASLCHQRCQQ